MLHSTSISSIPRGVKCLIPRRGNLQITLTNNCYDDTIQANRVQSAGFIIFTTQDSTDEPNEVVTLTFTDDPDNPRPSGVAQINVSGTVTVVDDDPTIVSLAKVGSATSINEGGKVEFTVTLGRALVAGEIIDVPLSISGTGVTTGDWSLAKKSGDSLNTGVTLQDTGTATPKVRFSGAAAQTATLELTATADGTSEGSETINVALGPDGTGANGFDHTSLGTNVGGGADPHNTNNDFDIMITGDTTPPRVTSITRQTPSSSPTNADELTWRVTFNEAVQNVNPADFVTSGNGSPDLWALVTQATRVGNTNAYDVTVSGDAPILQGVGNLDVFNGTVTLEFASGQDIEDSSGNSLSNTTPTGTNHNSFLVDNTAPRVTSITRQTPSSSPTNADVLRWRVTFNEAVQNVDAADFQVSGATATLLVAQVGATNAYNVTATAGNLANLDGTVTLSFANNQNIEDTSGNGLSNTTPTGTNDNTFEMDNIAPRVSSITRQTPSSSPTNADSLMWRVTFSEAVQNVNAADFQVSGSTNALVTAQRVGDGYAIYDVTASGGNLASLTGTVTLSFTSVQNIVDTSDNDLSNTTPTGTNDNTFVVDNTQVLDLSTSSSPANEGTAATLGIAATGATSNQTVAGGTALLTFSGEGIASSDYSVVAQNSFSLTGGPPPAATATVNLAADSADEPNETLVVGWQNLPSGYGAGTTATVTIIDQNPTTVTLAGGGTVAEDGSNSADVTVTLGRNLVAGETVTVPLAISGTGIAGSDYTIAPAPGAGNNTGVTLNTNSPHSAAQPAAVFTGHGTDTVQVATLRVTAVQDATDEGASEALTVGFGSGNRAVTSNLDRISGTGTGGTTTAGTATVTITDDDGAGLAITETANDTTVSEDGATTTDTYTVALNTEPTHDVTVTATASAGVQVAAPGGTAGGTATLTFTTSNYSTAQMVTVTGVDDNTDNPGGGREVSISHAASSTDTNYTIASAGSVSVTVTDDDATTVTLAAAAGNMEEGETKEFTITLGRGLVDGETLTVPLTFGGTATRGTDYTMASTSATGVQYNNLDSGNATVVFTGPESGATATRATITLSATADSVVESTAEMVVIGLGSITTTGLTGAGGVSETDSLGDFSISDAPPTGLAITETADDTTVSEDGTTTTDTYTVALKTEPTHGVTVTATSGDTAAATVNPGTLTFTTSNYSTAQTVTVTGVDDNTDNPGGGREVTISHAASSTDPNYIIPSTGSVGVTVTDDDPTTVTLAAAAGNIEEGQMKEFTIMLGRGLVDGEILTVPLTFGGKAARGMDYTLSGTAATGVQYNNLVSGTATVVFTGPESGATATRATITLSATADSTVESTPETVEIGLGTVTNTGLTGAGGVMSRTDSLAPFTIADEDGSSAGVAITESGGSTSVTEAAGPTNTDTYTVVLKSQPTATMTITVESGDPGAAMVSPAALTFDPTNWDKARTVTVTGVDDSGVQSGNRSVIISHSATSTDAKYNGNTIRDVVATVVDDDSPGPSALPAVEFAAAAYSGGEALGSRTVNVALSATPTFTAATTVSYAVSGTATAGEDFTPLPGTVSMTGGAGVIPITILQDQMDDDGETIVLTLIAANGYTVGTQGSATITITDDDGTTPPPSTLPVVSITGGGGVSEGEEASFTVTATPAPPPGTTISVNVRISASDDFASSGQTGFRSITIDASGRASFTVTTEDDTIQEEDGRIMATVRRGSGYTPHDTTASASVTVADDEVVRLSHSRLRVAAGGSASYQVALDDRPTGDVTVTIRVGGVNGEGGAVPSPNLSPPGTSPWDGANTMEGETSIRVHPATLTFTPANWDLEQPVTLTAPEEGDLIGTAITLTHTATGGGHVNVSTTMRLTVVAAHASEETKAWHLRLGRTLAHQVVDALEERWSAPPATGLQLTVAGETVVPSATAVAEHEGLLTKALGFETVTPQELVEGSSFSLAPGPEAEAEGGAPRLAFWGQGAFSSFSGEQEDLSLDGDVTTLLLGADWHTEHWQAGAALSQSWGSGSYDGENGADGEISSTVTGLFPYGRYALTPRLGLWAVAGYGWGELSLKPDGPGDDATPNTTLGMAAIGLDGVLRDGGSEGITLTTTADVLTLKTTSAEVDGLDSSEGSLSRRRVGLEAVRPFPLSNGASLLPSMALGIRHDSGDAEAGYGLDLGAAIRWQAPQQGISGELKGHTLLTHTEESLQEQSLALSFSWQPHPSNHGPSLSLSHAMGAIAAGDMDTLLHPTTMEGLDAEPGNGQRLTAELAYGFPAHNDHITLTPAVALAFSPTSRNYSLLWSVAPYPELQGEPWELSLEGEWQEQNTATAPVDHSLKLRFSWLF